MKHLVQGMLGACSALVVAAACSADSTAPAQAGAPLQATPLKQDSSGSTATAAGFTFVLSSKVADGPANVEPLLRPTLTTTVTLRNTRPDSATLQFGACAVSLVAYKTADREGAPLWRSGASLPWEGTYGRACSLILYSQKVAPGAELSLGGYSSRLIEILGDSLPDGRYYFTATVGVSVAPSGVSIPAGDFDLVLARPPLRDSLTHDLITYTASSAIEGGMVRGKVTATLTHAGGMLTEFPRECVVQLVAYRFRERRDAAPRSGAPDWRDARSCSPGWQQTGLNRGQSIVFETTASARDILGSSLPQGTYYLAVIVHTKSRDVWLSAGSAELRR